MLHQFKVVDFEGVDFSILVELLWEGSATTRLPCLVFSLYQTISVLQVFTSTLQLDSHEQLWLVLLVALASMVTSAATAYILIR